MLIRQAVILVGGRGTRLGDLTANTPKPLLPVGGIPFLDYVLQQISRHGFTDVVLLCGYKPDEFTAFLAERTPPSLAVHMSREPETLCGTAGALVHARDLLDESFLLLNGDTFFDINLLDLAVLAEQSRAMATMALVPMKGDRYGTVTLDGNLIGAFNDPQMRVPGPINGGIYVMRRDVIDRVTTTPCSLEKDIFPTLAEQSLIAGRVYDRPFIDIGVPQDFDRAQTYIPSLVRRPAVFLDRDGVLNDDLGYVHRIEDFHWKQGAREAVKLLNDTGFHVFVVTNQAGVARGYYDEATVQALHRWINDEMRAVGAHIDAFEYCPFHPEGALPEYRQVSERRKPRPGMIADLVESYPVDLERSFLIGDKVSDIGAAEALGIPGYLFEGSDLLAFVEAVLRDRVGEKALAAEE